MALTIRTNTTPMAAETHAAPGVRPPGFRLPAETALGPVSLQVSDLNRSLAYYEGVLGFRVEREAPNRASLRTAGDVHPLVHLVEHPGVRPAPRRSTLGLYHFAILLPARADLGRLLAHLSAAGVRIGSADHLVSEAIYLSDPDGLGIEVYADRPRSSWRYQGSELVMGTEPLDIRDLVASGGTGAWTGMPTGTTMGHVHLHVGSLAEAAAFYHAGLGLDKVVWTYPGALFLSAGGYHHHLGTNTWSQGPPAAPDQARLLSWNLVVPTDADARAAALSLATAHFVVTPLGAGWSVVDPWGTRVHVVPADHRTVEPRT